MSKTKKILLALFMFSAAALCLGCRHFPQVSATGEESSELLLKDPSLDEEIGQFQETYRGEVENYRKLHQQYVVAKEQYYQLNTLRSLEEAVKATREVMLARDDVLLTYFELLKLEVRSTHGIDLQRKDQAIQDISAAIEAVRVHKAQAQQAQDKEAIAEVATAFRALTRQLNSASYRAQAAMTIGHLQLVYDKAVIIRDEILHLYETEPSITDLQKSERQRALNETNRLVTETFADLGRANTVFNQRQDHEKGHYDEIRKNLSPVYAKLSQVLTFLNELLTF